MKFLHTGKRDTHPEDLARIAVAKCPTLDQAGLLEFAGPNPGGLSSLQIAPLWNKNSTHLIDVSNSRAQGRWQTFKRPSEHFLLVAPAVQDGTLENDRTIGSNRRERGEQEGVGLLNCGSRLLEQTTTDSRRTVNRENVSCALFQNPCHRSVPC